MEELDNRLVWNDSVMHMIMLQSTRIKEVNFTTNIVIKIYYVRVDVCDSEHNVIFIYISRLYLRYMHAFECVCIAIQRYKICYYF